MIEYSPYDTDVPDIDYNTSQILAMNDHLKSEDTLSFALISDSHTSYDELEKMIKVINKIEGLTFIANCGDLTDAGLADEFERYHKIISKSGYPVVSLIGNHDHRSNGAQIYQKIFGQPNQSFVSGDYKFVLFDNVIWENNNLSPKYDWLINQLADTNHTNILLTHIPPWSDQFEGLNNLVYKQIVAPQNTLLCLHGHLHHHTDTTYNGIRTIVSGSVDEAGYSIVKLFNKQVFINYYPNK
jgi:Icc-related predicted phosphoesterase